MTCYYSGAREHVLQCKQNRTVLPYRPWRQGCRPEADDLLQFYAVPPHAEQLTDIKIPLIFLGRLCSPLLNYFPPPLPPTDHHTVLHAHVISHSRENDFEARSETVHRRYNQKTQFMIAVYCHILVAEGRRETFARLLNGRRLSDNEDFISTSY